MNRRYDFPFGMKSFDDLCRMRIERALLVWSMLIASAGCLPSFSLPEESLEVAPACGSEGQACCREGEPPCGPELQCDRDSGLCQRQERRYCVDDAQCRAGQTCCVSGLIGSCVSLAPGSECPRADLQLATTLETLSPFRQDRFFDPVTSAEDACAIEKGCVGSVGLRKLLHFTTAVVNEGAADLLLGAPSAPHFAPAICDEQPYLANFLTYQLVDVEGVVAAEGHMQAQCSTVPDPFVSTFDCEFYGLSSAYSQVYLPTDPAAGVDTTPCQGLDITDVAPGNYLLRMQVNAQGLLLESDPNNNRLDLPIQLPALDDPAQPCLGPGEASLFGDDLDRECGWSESSALTLCTPGQRVTLACPDCSGDPMLRVCDGASPCSAESALASGDESNTCDGTSLRSDDECLALECCAPVSACPAVSFDCPSSGAYSAYAAPWFSNADASCRASVQPSMNAGTNAPPQ